MTEFTQWYNSNLLKQAVESLTINGFSAIYIDSQEKARDYIVGKITPNSIVAFGGSQSVKQLQIKEAAMRKNAIIFDHNDSSLTLEQKIEIMRKELLSDIFICSCNALTLDGKIVNIDGFGNRVAAMTFGPRQVIIVAGYNKIVKDEQAAFERAQNIAAPINMKRLNKKTPCTFDAQCHNCDSNERGCRIYSIIKKQPSFTPIEVVLVGDSLGF